MKGITYTQVAQYIVLICAYLVPAFFISLNLTGNPLPQLGLGSDFVGTDQSLLAKLDHVVAFFLHFEEFQAHGILPKSLWGIHFSIITEYYAPILSSHYIFFHCLIHTKLIVTFSSACQSMAEYVIHVFCECNHKR
jgi:hypothetical protein